MTNINLATNANPVKEVCDYLHIYPSWHWHMDDVVSHGNHVHSFNLVKTTRDKNHIIHIHNVDGLGLTIADVSAHTLTQQ